MVKNSQNLSFSYSDYLSFLSMHFCILLQHRLQASSTALFLGRYGAPYYIDHLHLFYFPYTSYIHWINMQQLSQQADQVLSYHYQHYYNIITLLSEQVHDHEILLYGQIATISPSLLVYLQLLILLQRTNHYWLSCQTTCILILA